MTIDQDEFLRQAIETPSHDDVTALQELLGRTLGEVGHEYQRDEFGNVHATREGTGSTGAHLVRNTHVDTVPPHVPYARDGDIHPGARGLRCQRSIDGPARPRSNAVG